jgi:hypothetical protein
MSKFKPSRRTLVLKLADASADADMSAHGACRAEHPTISALHFNGFDGRNVLRRGTAIAMT